MISFSEKELFSQNKRYCKKGTKHTTNSKISLGTFLNRMKNKFNQSEVEKGETQYSEILVTHLRAIQDSEENFSNIIERVNCGVTVIQDWVLKYVNPSLTRILGYSPEDMLNTPFTNYVHPDVLPELIDRYQRRMTGRDAPLTYESKLIKKDGNPIYVEINAGLITYQKELADLVIIRDITKDKRREENSSKSEKRYQMIVEKLREGVLLEDLNGNITFINPQVVEMLGYTREELLGKHWMTIVPPGEVEKIKVQTSLRSFGITNSYESFLKTKDGQLIPVIITATPLFTDSGAFEGVLTVFTDITKRKQAEEALFETKEKYQMLVENTEVGILSINAIDGKIVFHNQEVASMLGYSSDQLCSMTLFDFIFQDDLDLVQKAVLKKNCDTEFRAIMKNGDLIWLKMKISPILRSGDKMENQCFFWDITQEKILQELQDSFIATTNHELRTPVTVLKGYIEFLQKNPKISLEQVTQIYHTLAKNIDRLIKLIEAVHDFSLIQDQKFEISRDLVNLDEFIQNLIDQLTLLYPKRPIFLNYYIQGSTQPYVRFDQYRMLQVIHNIVSNAIKNSSPDSFIGITFIRKSRDFQLCIEDQGVGIAQEDLFQLFQPFSHRSSKHSTTGMGLGLFLVKTIIEAHKGIITCETQHKVGSIFNVTIPLYKE